MEYEIVPGKNAKTNYLFDTVENYLYVPVNKVSGRQRYTCFEKGCSAGVSIRSTDKTATRSKKQHSIHGQHKAKKKKIAAIRAVKDKCLDVNELFSNQRISTKAPFDKEILRYFFHLFGCSANSHRLHITYYYYLIHNRNPEAMTYERRSLLEVGTILEALQRKCVS